MKKVRGKTESVRAHTHTPTKRESERQRWEMKRTGRSS